MALNFILVVNDGGELKTVIADEFLESMQEAVGIRTNVEKLVDDSLNKVLDAKSEFAHDDEIEERLREARSMTDGQ